MKFQPPKGTKDIWPEEMRVRQKILDTLKNIFELYGFQPIETPALERWEVLSAKGGGGPEILKETYNFKDKAGRMIGLRYDLTIPLARVVASNPSLHLPFKRYQIQKVWRYGDVAKGRLREFLQADIDIVGTKSMVADAEIISCSIDALTALGFKNFTVRLNNRKILSALVEYAGIEEKKAMDVFRSIDKLEKIGIKGVERELTERGVSVNAKNKILKLIQIEGESESVLRRVNKIIGKIEEGKEGIKELKEIVVYLKKMGIKSKVKVDLSLARGLDYYTGPIFEIFAEEGIGSIAGGGRYDRLIRLFSGRDLPATGISFGIERIIQVMRDRKMVEVSKSNVKVFVVSVNEKCREGMLKIVKKLRENEIPTDFDLKGRSLTKQLEYADSLGIPYAIIVGEKELKTNKFKLKNMKERKEETLNLKEIIKLLKGK